MLMLRLARLLLPKRLKQGWQALRILQKAYATSQVAQRCTSLPASMRHCQQWCMHCFGLYCTNDFPQFLRDQCSSPGGMKRACQII